MKSLLFCVVAAIGLFTLSESLVCNKCKAGLFGLCVISGNETCWTTTSVCTTTKISFPDISGFNGFASMSCNEPTQCNTTSNGTTLGFVSYSISQNCCSTDLCNKNSAPYMELSISAALGAALLTCIFSQSIY